jgi:hypothetical protein
VSLLHREKSGDLSASVRSISRLPIPSARLAVIPLEVKDALIPIGEAVLARIRQYAADTP